MWKMRMPFRIMGILLLLMLLFIGYEVLFESPFESCSKPKPRMTAPEVLQYVNQALRNEYIPHTFPVIRYEVRHTALNAVYGKAVYGQVVDEEMNRIIKALSPEALRLFREQLLERLKPLTPQDRKTALSRLRGISAVEDIVSEFEGSIPEGTRVWEVNVKVVVEPQWLNRGQWVVHPNLETKTYIQQYLFSEVTGALIER